MVSGILSWLLYVLLDGCCANRNRQRSDKIDPNWWRGSWNFNLPIQTDLRRKVRPWFLQKDGKPKATKPYYDVAGFAFTQAALSYIAVSFVACFPRLGWKETCSNFYGGYVQLLGPSRAFTVYESLYYIGHILIFGLFVILRFVLPSPANGSQTASRWAGRFSTKDRPILWTRNRRGEGFEDEKRTWFYFTNSILCHQPTIKFSKSSLV